MALDFTFLTEEQIWGDDDGNGQLDAIERYGTKVAPTDLTVLLGGRITRDADHRTSENDLTCESWSASLVRNDYVRCVYFKGIKYWYYVDMHVISARPALPPSEASKISPSKTRTLPSGVQIAEYGEYPQTVVDELTFLELERGYNLKSIYPTGKNYTFNSVDIHGHFTPFKAKTYPEYELNGKKYIRVPGYPSEDNSKLSTGEQVKRGKAYWVEVQPIEWLMDKSGWMVSKKCLFAGVHIDTLETHHSDFSKTFMKKYLDTYFAREIEPSKMVDKEAIKGLSERLAEISDLEKVKATVTPARTPERTDILTRITRVRKAKSLLSKAAQKAHEEGDEKTLQEIVEMAKPFAAREAAVLNKFHQRQATRRAARRQSNRE